MELHELPSLQEIYTELRKGRHISIEDGAIFSALESHYDDFQNLCTGLGLKLVRHERGFYYLEDDSAPKAAQKIFLFMAILLEHLDDKGFNSNQDLLAIRIDPVRLPHLQHEKYRAVMAEVGVDKEEGVVGVLKSMARYGLAEPDPDQAGIWRLRTGAYRILDVVNMAGRAVGPNASNDTEGLVPVPATDEAAL